MTDKIAIHVPDEWLSEAVQRKLFDMGYGWGREKVQRICDTSNRAEPCINISDNDKAIFFDGKSHFDKSYTILTVDEFFAREEALSKHTPTPWRMSDIRIGIYDGEIIAVSGESVAKVLRDYVSGSERTANAQFIVKACNLHDEMVAVLRATITTLSLGYKIEGIPEDERLKELRELLTQAEVDNG